MDAIRWTEEDILEAAHEWDEHFEPSECELLEIQTSTGPCLVVHHRPTGRTTDEAGDAGRWHTDMTPYGTED